MLDDAISEMRYMRSTKFSLLSIVYLSIDRLSGFFFP